MAGQDHGYLGAVKVFAMDDGLDGLLDLLVVECFVFPLEALYVLHRDQVIV